MRAALLCVFVVLLAATTCKSRRNPCVCLKISNSKLHLSRIRTYYIQKSGLCHITAAVLQTVKGRTVCANPDESWVIKAMKLVDAKKRPVSSTTRPMSTASERALMTTGGSYNTS